ncbi:ABC transporter permease [Thalassotalea fusca]
MSIFKSAWFKQSLRLFQHELRRGELTIICLAIILAVATVFSLSGFSGQIRQAIMANSTTFIAADRILITPRPVDEAIILKSQELNVDHAAQIETDSIVFAGDRMQLAEIKAVSAKYPLRGELLVSTDGVKQNQKPVNAPKTDTVWVEPALLMKLDVVLGDEIEVGVGKFTIAGVVHNIPDASFSVFTSGPTVILNIDDLPKTQLIKPASRVSYTQLFAGEEEAVERFEEWIKPQVNETQRWRDIKSGQSPLASALNRAEKFLSLASMLGIVLAAVAVAVASRRYSQRHQPMVAVFKALGASMRHIRKLYLLHWALLSLFSIGFGLIVGYVLLALGINAISEYLEVGNAQLPLYPFIVAIVTGLVCATAFAITPLKSLISTPAMSVIRGFNQHTFGKVSVQIIIPILALFGLLLLFSRDWLLSLSLLVGGIVVSAVLLLIGKLIMGAGRQVGSNAGKSFYLALANLKRRANENSVQMVSFTVAIKLLLVILVLKNTLINEWQDQLPDDASNRFLVNIAANEVAAVESFVDTTTVTSSGLYPVVRGRLAAINDEKVAKEVTKEDNKEADRGRRGVGRELNLTWRADLPERNKIIEGEWFQDDDVKLQVSVESSIAERLELKLGDTLTFTLGSDEVTVEITSLREVDWQSMQPNFFMIFNPAVLQDFPATYISGLYVPETELDGFAQLMTQYPTVSMIDVDAIIGQLRSVIEQVSVAIELILILVVVAGSLVLVAQVQASMEERERELAILRTLGAKGALLRNSVLFEFLALGAIAGLMASIAMELALYFLQTQTFDMEPSLHLSYWGVGILSGAFFVGAVGLVSCWRLLNLSSVTLIRRTM